MGFMLNEGHLCGLMFIEGHLCEVHGYQRSPVWGSYLMRGTCVGFMIIERYL